MKLGQLVESKEVLDYLGKQKLPISFAFSYRTFLEGIVPHISNYEKLRIEKVMELGEESEDKKGMYNVKEENVEQFKKEMMELLEQDIIVPEFSIDIDMLEKSNILLSVEDLSKISWLLKKE
jgi:hypothetical protein